MQGTGGRGGLSAWIAGHVVESYDTLPKCVGVWICITMPSRSPSVWGCGAVSHRPHAAPGPCVGINRSRVEDMETRLKQDILAEAQTFGNQVGVLGGNQVGGMRAATRRPTAPILTES